MQISHISQIWRRGKRGSLMLDDSLLSVNTTFSALQNAGNCAATVGAANLKTQLRLI